MKAVKAVQFVTLLLFSLVTGVFWGTWFSLSRSMAEITPATFLEVGRLMIANLGGPMSMLMPAAVLSAVALSVLLFRRRHTRASFFAGAALVLMVIAMTITLAVNVPIDRQIQSWTTATLPGDWNAIRDRWEYFHGLRTLVSLVALACLFASTLSTSEPATTRDHQVQPGEQRVATVYIRQHDVSTVATKPRSRRLQHLLARWQFLVQAAQRR